MFIFDISFNIGIYKIVPPASCSPRLTQIRRTLYGLNRICTHSSSTPSTVLAFCVGVTRIYSGKVLEFEVHILARAAFLKSMVFSVGIHRFKVRGVVYSYQTIDAMLWSSYPGY